jgi:CheY-like chemotaxis protein
MAEKSAEGRRILVVEDAPMIALDLEEMLRDLGWDVVGPTGNFAIALQLATDEPLDAAVVDINIRGGKVYPVARTLAARGIPFLLASGYADRTLPPDLADRPCLEKPYNPANLERMLGELVVA